MPDLAIWAESLSFEQVQAMVERDFPAMLWLVRQDEREGYFANLFSPIPAFVEEHETMAEFEAHRARVEAATKSEDQGIEHETERGRQMSFPAYGPTALAALARAYQKALAQ